MQFTIRGFMMTSLGLGLLLGVIAQLRSMPGGERLAVSILIVAALAVFIVLSIGLAVSFVCHLTRRPPR